QLPPPKAFEELKSVATNLDNFVCVGFVRQAKYLPYKIHAADAPSFSAFALNSRANAAPGSFNRRTRRVAGDNSSPRNCACKISRVGNSAKVSNSAVESTARSTKPTRSAASLNSVANVLK